MNSKLIKDDTITKYRVIDAEGNVIMENVTYMNAFSFIDNLSEDVKSQFSLVPVVGDGRQILFENS
jgi:hypothetical protein